MSAMNNETRGLGLAPATADDSRELARKRLPRHPFDYLDGATDVAALDRETLLHAGNVSNAANFG